MIARDENGYAPAIVHDYSAPAGYPIEPPRRPCRWPVALAIGAGVLFAATVARAAMEGLAEPESPRTHQLTECRPGEPCRSRGRPMGVTACSLDAASLANVAPKATVIRCERVKP